VKEKRLGITMILLKGKRVGQRSIRLSKAYRAIIDDSNQIVIKVVEVSKHE
jgi:proteic killer suppression protein